MAVPALGCTNAPGSIEGHLTPAASGEQLSMLLLALTACQLTTIQVEELTQTTVERGTLLEDWLDELGSGEWISLEVTAHRPDQDTVVQGASGMDVRVTAQGARGALSRD